jgi:hypothetical protein
MKPHPLTSRGKLALEAILNIRLINYYTVIYNNKDNKIKKKRRTSSGNDGVSVRKRRKEIWSTK